MLKRIRSAVAAYRSPDFAESLARIEANLSLQEDKLSLCISSLSTELEEQGKKIQDIVSELRDELNRNVAQVAEDVEHSKAQIADFYASAGRFDDGDREYGLVGGREPLTESDYEAISQKGVFVVGAARSGTTILHTCFNLSPDVYMLGEANFWEIPIRCTLTNQSTYDFVSIFNDRHRRYRNPKLKGLYLNRGPFKDRDMFDALYRLGRQYRYVGDKIAIGTAIKKIGDDWEPELLEFQARYFFFSNYFIIIRRPAESIWSMTKMIPEIPVERYIACWLKSVRVSLDICLLFPNAYVVFHEDLCEDTIRVFEQLLGVDIPVPDGLLTPHSQRSYLHDELPAVLHPFRDDLRTFQQFYTEIRDQFDRTSLKSVEKIVHHGFFPTVRQKLTEAIDRYEALYAETSSSAA